MRYVKKLAVTHDARLKSRVRAFVLLAGLAAGGARAAKMPATPPARPTRVAASFFVSAIENVDSIRETFNADFYLRLEWNDPRLARLSSGEIDGGTIWQPKAEAVNSRDLQQPWEPYFQFPEPGKLVLLSRLHGTFAAPMDLHDFPFDHQVLPIEIESSVSPASEMIFYPGNRRKERGWTAPLKPEKVLGNSVRLPEWKIEAVQVREIDKYYKFENTSYSRYRVEILVSRRSGFYVWKIMMIEAMIVVLSWVVFLMDAGDLGNRLVVSVTLLLATVAFSYVINEITPKISYLTLLDWFLVGCFVLIFLSALEAVAVNFLQRVEKGAVAAGIDRWSVVAFPFLFLLLNLLLWVSVLV